MKQPHNLIQSKLGMEASLPGYYPLSKPIPAGDSVAYVVFRNIQIAAIGLGHDGALADLEKKITARVDEIMALVEIPNVEEINVVRESFSGPSHRFPVRPMSVDRALLELDLGVEQTFLFMNDKTGLFQVIWRNLDGDPTTFRVGEPIFGDDSPIKPLPVPGRTPTAEQEIPLRQGKQTAIRSMLRCPFCKGQLVEKALNLECPSCPKVYPFLDGKPILTMDPQYDPRPDSQPESNNTYGAQALDLIERNRDGWVLDMGSGNPSAEFYNVVHLDLFAFNNVDVVTDGQNLPFGDDTFAAVLSEAVLEHVTDPIGYMKELARVMKPGGQVRLDAAFMQPYHDYPDHYFNMTKSGLRHVIEAAGLEVIDIGAGPHQKPFISLGLLLNIFIQGTRDPARQERLLNLKLSEAMDIISKGESDPFDGLCQEAIDRIAAGFGCLATKPSAD